MTDGTVVTVDYTFIIKASASGGASASKSVAISIVVCGFEVLSQDATVLDFTLEVNPAATNTLQPVTNLFSSNDTYCPPKTYAVKTF